MSRDPNDPTEPPGPGDSILVVDPDGVATRGTPIDLGTLDGVPLCFTDGATLPDGAWVFCASAVSPASTSHSRYPTAAA